MKKESWVYNWRTIVWALLLFFAICEGYFWVKDKAVDNSNLIDSHGSRINILEDFHHSIDLRVSKLETINELRMRSKLT